MKQGYKPWAVGVGILKIRRALGCITALTQIAAGQPVDPHLDLENVSGPTALTVVKNWNPRTLKTLAAQPGFAADRTRAELLLSDNHRLAEPELIGGGMVFNLWQDASHPRGVWRMSPYAAYAKGNPAWRTLIDIDQLSQKESRKWAFKGAECLAPAYTDCLVKLSDGGSYAVAVREFDVSRGTFVPGGFALPLAKSEVAWHDKDAIFVGADEGPSSLTTSGYARTIRMWRRGSILAFSKLIAEVGRGDVKVGVETIDDAGRNWTVIVGNPSLFSRPIYHVAPDGRLIHWPLPDDADLKDIVDGRAVGLLNSEWDGHVAGSLVAYSIPDLLAGKAPKIETVFAPTSHQAVETASASRSLLWVKYLDDVSGRLVALSRDRSGHWSGVAALLPDNATIHVEGANRDEDTVFAQVEGLLLPPTLYRISSAQPPVAVQSLPPRFDAAGMTVERRFAMSKEGTRIPYFIARKAGTPNEPVPALLQAYGGFAVSQTPSYLADEPHRTNPVALLWVERGNAYVMASIRGGGEYGSRWHEAALKEKRQTAYDDLYAVAEDLIKTGVTTKGDIAVSGRSNGGLTAGVAFTQRPDLFGAAVIGSPLLDMRRFTHLFAGASWVAEYGDPDTSDWSYISRYSPYQNLKPNVRYPVPFIYTSTSDDNVHPGHARKFAARLQDYADPFFYDEALEGGHSASVEPKQQALLAAKIMSYLDLELPHGASPRHIGPR